MCGITSRKQYDISQIGLKQNGEPAAGRLLVYASACFTFPLFSFLRGRQLRIHGLQQFLQKCAVVHLVHEKHPFDDPAYIAHFQLILQALREKRKLRITFTGARGKRNTWVFVLYKLEYSVKDDKFRLLTAQTYYGTVNLGRIEACELLGPYSPAAFHLPQVKMDTLVMELTDERNALERAMVHFSHFEKETERLEENRYRVTLRYSREDETELVIRLLSFGPVLKVLSPQNMMDELRKRILRQRYLSSKAGRAEMEE